MTFEEALGKLMGWAEALSPWIIGAMIVFTVIFVAMFAFALTFIIRTHRSMSKHNKEFDRRFYR